MTPASCVVETFGGIRATARMLDVEPSTVLRWLRPSEVNGVNQGVVPQRHFERILVEAHKQGKHLNVEHLVIGRNNNRTIVRDGKRVAPPAFDQMVSALASA